MRKAVPATLFILIVLSVSCGQVEGISFSPISRLWKGDSKGDNVVDRRQSADVNKQAGDSSLVTDISQLDIDISKPLALNQCIQTAMQLSTSIRVANLDLKTVKLDLEDARAEYLPEINAVGQYRFSDTVDFGWDRKNYDAQINAGYTIWDHGRREAGLAQSKADERAAKSDYERIRQNLIFNITEAYYNLLQAKRLIAVEEKLVDISRTNVEKVKAFQEAERAIPADVATARVQLANDELALVNAQNNLELARARLASLIGLNPGIAYDIQDDPDYKLYTEASLVPYEVSVEDSIAGAIKDRPEIISLQARLTSLEWSLMLARMNRWPVITAEYSYNVLLDDYLRDRDNFKKYRNWAAVARVSFPLFDSGASRRREKSAEIAVMQTKEDINERERSIKLEVQQAYLDLESSKKSLEIAREQAKNAAESLDATQGRYEQNVVIFLEVLSAQTRYAQALINQVRAFYDYQMAYKNLQKAMGALQFED